ncbi:MAG: alcohol dehydrogenase catalytic domain-containing protein [Acidimicrobiales bacterium]
MTDSLSTAAMPAAVFERKGEVAVQERPVPTPGPGQVLVEVRYCGICGSDLHLMFEGWGQPGLIAGHEFTAVVAALGDGVDAWAVGDEVVGGASPRCGRCRRCREGLPSQCEQRGGSITDSSDGAFARYTVVDARSLLRLPDGLSSREAALAEPLAVALHAITRSGIVAGDSAMVLGAGPIGALVLAALAVRGIGGVTVVEPGVGRRRLALDLGAADVLDPTELEVYPMHEPERISPRAVDVVFECSGKRSAMEAGFHQLGRGGQLVLVGAGIEAPSFDPNRMILNELGVCGSFVYDADGFEQALAMLGSGALPTGVLIDPTDVPLDRISDALSDLASGRIAGKAMVVPRLSSDGPTPAHEEQP